MRSTPRSESSNFAPSCSRASLVPARRRSISARSRPHWQGQELAPAGSGNRADARSGWTILASFRASKWRSCIPAFGDSERAEQWRRIRNGQARVVVGTRSGVFAPVQNLGLVIVDEEHDGSYKQQETPRYHGRDVALMRAKEANAVAVLGLGHSQY